MSRRRSGNELLDAARAGAAARGVVLLAIARGDISQPDGRAAADSRANAKRVRTGANFQAEMDATAEIFAAKRLGFLQRHHPEAVHTRNGWALKKGGAPCDYSGHVNLALSVERARGSLLNAYTARAYGDPYPVTFDVKVLRETAASYTHEPERVHQLDTLRAASRAGSHAFILVHVRRIRAAVLIGSEWFDKLQAGGSVAIVEACPPRVAGWPDAAPLTDRPPLMRPGMILETAPTGDAFKGRPVKLLLPAIPHGPQGWDFAPALFYVAPDFGRAAGG